MKQTQRSFDILICIDSRRWFQQIVFCQLCFVFTRIQQDSSIWPHVSIKQFCLLQNTLFLGKGENTGVLSQTFTEQLKIARLRRFYTSSERFLLCAFRAPYQQPRVFYYYISAEVLKALLTLPPSVCFPFQRPVIPRKQKVV